MASADPLGRCGLYRGRCSVRCLSLTPIQPRGSLIIEKIEEPSAQSGCPTAHADPSGRQCRFVACLEESGLEHCYQCSSFGSARCLVLRGLYRACWSMALEEAGDGPQDQPRLGSQLHLELEETEEAWECPECGAPVGCWDLQCPNCGAYLEVGEA